MRLGLGVVCSNTKYSSYTRSTFRKREELISYNYAVRISIYALVLPSFLTITALVVTVTGSVTGTGRLPQIATDCGITCPLRLIYILFAVLTP